MFFRFGSAVTLVVLISLAGVALEKQTLSLRRALSRQHFRAARLEEERERLRMQTERLASPQQLFERIRQSDAKARDRDLAEPHKQAIRTLSHGRTHD